MGNTTNQCKGKDPFECPVTAGCNGGYDAGRYVCYQINGRMGDQMPDKANMLNPLDVERVLRAVNGNM